MRRIKKGIALCIGLAFFLAAVVPASVLAATPANQWVYKGRFENLEYTLCSYPEAAEPPYGPRWDGTKLNEDGQMAGGTGPVSGYSSIATLANVIHAEFETAAYAAAQVPAGMGGYGDGSTIQWVWSPDDPRASGVNMDTWWKDANEINGDIVTDLYPAAVPAAAIEDWLKQGEEGKQTFQAKWEATWNLWAGKTAKSEAVQPLVSTMPDGCQAEKALAWIWPMSAAFSNLTMSPESTQNWAPNAKDEIYIGVRCNNGTAYSYYTAKVNVSPLEISTKDRFTGVVGQQPTENSITLKGQSSSKLPAGAEVQILKAGKSSDEFTGKVSEAGSETAACEVTITPTEGTKVPEGNTQYTVQVVQPAEGDGNPTVLAEGSFTVAPDGAQTITGVNLDLDAPTANGTPTAVTALNPTATAVTDGESSIISDAFSGNPALVWNPALIDGAFAGNTAYTATVTLDLNAPVAALPTDLNTLDVTLKDAAVSEADNIQIVPSQESGKLKLQITFPKTAASNVEAPSAALSGAPGSTVQISLPWDGDKPAEEVIKDYTVTASATSNTTPPAPDLDNILTVGSTGVTGELQIPADATVGTQYTYSVELKAGQITQKPVTLTVAVRAPEYTLSGSINGSTSSSAPSTGWIVGTQMPVLKVSAVNEDKSPVTTGLKYTWSSGQFGSISGQTSDTLDLGSLANAAALLGESGSKTFTCNVATDTPVTLLPSSAVSFTIDVSLPGSGTIAIAAEPANVDWTIGTTKPVLTVTATHSDGSPVSSGLSYTWYSGEVQLPNGTGSSGTLDLSTLEGALGNPHAGNKYTYSCKVASNGNLFDLTPASGMVEFEITAQEAPKGVIALAADKGTVAWNVGDLLPTLTVVTTPPGIDGLSYTWVGPTNEVIEGQTGPSLDLNQVENADQLLGTKDQEVEFWCTVSAGVSAAEFLPADGVVDFTIAVTPPPDGSIVFYGNDEQPTWTVGTNKPVLIVNAINGDGNPVTEGLEYTWTGPNNTPIANQTNTLNLDALADADTLLGTGNAKRTFTCTIKNNTVATPKPASGKITFDVNVVALKSNEIALSADKATQSWTIGSPRPTLTVESKVGGSGSPTLSYIWTGPDGNEIAGQTSSSLNLAQLPNGAELLGTEAGPVVFTCKVTSYNRVPMVPADGIVKFTINAQLPAAGTVMLSPGTPNVEWTVGTTKPTLNVVATSSIGTPVHSGLSYAWMGPDGTQLTGQTSAVLDLSLLSNAADLLGKTNATKTFTCTVTPTNNVVLRPASTVAFNVQVKALQSGLIGLAAEKPVIDWTVGGTLPTLRTQITAASGTANSAGLTYSWSGPDGVIEDQTASTLNLNDVPGAAGMLGMDVATKTFFCSVVSSNGATLVPANGTVKFDVNVMPTSAPLPPATPSITLSASATQVAVGTAVKATAELSNWQNPTIKWSATGAGNPAPTDEAGDVNGYVATFTPTQPGMMTITAEITEGSTVMTEQISVNVVSDTPPSQQPSPSNTIYPYPTNYPSNTPSSVPSGTPSAIPSGSPSASASPSASPSATSSNVALEPNPSTSAPVHITTVNGVNGPVVTGIPISTNGSVHPVSSITDFVHVPNGATMRILEPNGSVAPVTEPISTGQIIEVKDSTGRVVSETTIIVPGDVLGTGNLNIAQLVRLASACTGERPLMGAYRAAGDFSSNGRVDIGDVVKEARMIADR